MTERDRPWRTAGRWLTAAGADLLDLVLPVTCTGCGAPGPPVCRGCARHWWAVPRRCEEHAGRLDRVDGAGPLPVAALAVNTGVVRRTVVAWKDGGRADATRWLARALRDATAASWTDAPWAVTLPAGPLVVVPAPPSRAGLRRRGEDLVAAVAGGAAAGLRAASCRALVRRAGGHDQVGLGARGRAANVAGRVRVRRRAADGLAGARVLLVDDVLTTGATLAACRAALEAVGAQVTGAVVLAVTPPPGAGAGWLVDGAEAG